MVLRMVMASRVCGVAQSLSYRASDIQTLTAPPASDVSPRVGACVHEGSAGSTG